MILLILVVRVSEMNPIDEHGRTVNVYPHRLVFLCPRLANDKTPPKIKEWLDFISDSLDGEIDENLYKNDYLQQIITTITEHNIDPDLLS